MSAPLRHVLIVIVSHTRIGRAAPQQALPQPAQRIEQAAHHSTAPARTRCSTASSPRYIASAQAAVWAMRAS